MRVQDILAHKGDRVVAVSEAAGLAQALRMMSEARIGALVVEDARGALTGVLSEREVVAALARRGAAALGRPVREAMVAAPATVGPQDAVTHAMAVMTERRARHLPVVSGGRVVGLLSTGDVVKSRLSEKTDEARVLQDLARWRRAA